MTVNRVGLASNCPISALVAGTTAARASRAAKTNRFKQSTLSTYSLTQFSRGSGRDVSAGGSFRSDVVTRLQRRIGGERHRIPLRDPTGHLDFADAGHAGVYGTAFDGLILE